MNYLNTLRSFSNQLQQLAEFKEGDQIDFSEKKLIKAAASNYVIINAICGQNSEKVIDEIKNLFEEMKKFSAESSKDPLTIFKRLKHFSCLKASIEKATGSSLDTFKKSCQEGSTNVIAPSSTKAKELGDKIEALRTTLTKEILPLINQQIECINDSIKQAKLASPLEFIIFLFNGKSPADLRSISQPSYSAEEVKKSLKSLFGRRVVNDVFSFYQLDSKHVLKSTDIQALTIGIKANLTKEDVLYLIENNCFLAMAFSDLTNSSRSEEAVLDILHHFRSSYCRKEIDLSQTRSKYEAQLQRDLDFLDICDLHQLYGWNKNYNHPLYNFQHHSQKEFLARDLIYHLYGKAGTQFSKGALFPCFTMKEGEKAKKLSCFQAWPLPCAKGVYPALILPLSAKEDAIEVQMVFRGTDPSDESWNRNISEIKVGSIEGVGAQSFKEVLPDLREGLKKALAEIKELFPKNSLQFEILGHSLGASDGARFCVDLIKQEDCKQNFGSLKLFAFNSPCISKEESLDFLACSEKADLPITCNYFKVSGDWFQEAGLILPGYFTKEQPLPKNVSVSVAVLKLDTQFNIGTGCIASTAENGCMSTMADKQKEALSLHTKRWFTNDNDTVPMSGPAIYTNKPDDQTIDELPGHLSATPGMWASTAIEAVTSFVSTSLNYFSSTIA